MFRGPSGRFINSAIRSSITFNLRGINVPHRRVIGQMTSTITTIGVTGFLSGRPTELSNKRGRQITVTKVITLSPSVVVLSRTAAVLSPRNHRRIVRAVRRVGRGRGLAIVSVARSVSRTTGTGHVFIVRTKRLAQVNSPRRVFDLNGRVVSVNLSVPFPRGLGCRLGERKLRIPRGCLARRKVIG